MGSSVSEKTVRGQEGEAHLKVIQTDGHEVRSNLVLVGVECDGFHSDSL